MAYVKNVYGLTQAPSFRKEWSEAGYVLLFGVDALKEKNLPDSIKLVVDSAGRLQDAGLPIVDAHQIPNKWWLTKVPPKALKPNEVRVRVTLCECNVEDKRGQYLPSVMKDIKPVIGKLTLNGDGSEKKT